VSKVLLDKIEPKMRKRLFPKIKIFGKSLLIGRGGRIRTIDPLLPKQMRYRAALHPDSAAFIGNSAFKRK
jgi:hypothetical protein